MAPKLGITEGPVPVQAGLDTLGLEDPVITGYIQPVEKRPPMQLVWRNIILMGMLHVGAIYAITLLPYAKWSTLAFTAFLYYCSATGITAGAHRLWAHRSYKARFPLRLLLALMNSSAFQNDVIEWSRDHRVHHKYSETEADPHNAKRGFFFSHVGWLLVRKHPDVKAKGKQLDLSDLHNDPILRFQRKFYVPSVILLCFVIPTVVPYYFFGESLWTSYFVCAVFKYCTSLNATWCVNSAAHMWGMHPYDKRISPAENRFVTTITVGEGYHNYHHVFPQDYRASEFGGIFNSTKLFIDFFEMIGLVYARKTISREMIQKRKQKTGDGSS